MNHKMITGFRKKKYLFANGTKVCSLVTSHIFSQYFCN